MKESVRFGLLDERRYAVEHVAGGDYCWLIIDRKDPSPTQIITFADMHVAEACAEELNDREMEPLWVDRIETAGTPSRRQRASNGRSRQAISRRRKT